MITTFALGGCERQPREPVVDDIVSGIISAASRITTYKLDTSLNNSYTVDIAGSSDYTNFTHWQGQALVDLADNATMFSMDITNSLVPSVTAYTWQEYMVGGWDYHNQISPKVFGPNGVVTWTKTLSTDQTSWRFVNAAYLVPQIELVQTARQVKVGTTERVDGIDCYILEITPTPEAAADWVLSQDVGRGPSLFWWFMGFERSKEIYMKAYHSSSVKLWVDRKSYRIIRAEVSLNFVVKPGNVTRDDMPLEGGSQFDENEVGFDRIVTDFQWLFRFSDYGQRLAIVPPQDALNAPEQ
jgi:hypothetical protein